MKTKLNTVTGGAKALDGNTKPKGPPPIPSGNVVVYDCLTGNIHRLASQDFVFGSSPSSDIHLGALGFKDGRVVLGRSGKRLQLLSDGGKHSIEINGSAFEGGLLPEAEEVSLVIDKMAFFFIRVGADATKWAEKLKSSPSRSWMLQIFEGGMEQFRKWKKLDCPFDFQGKYTIDRQTILEVIDEVGKRSWTEQVGIVYHGSAKAGFFANQFKQLSKPKELPDAGEYRDPRCWMRFETAAILAVHPSEYGDEILGETALKRFIPNNFGDGVPLTDDGVPVSRLACPHCRGELPPTFIEKPPHIISIVGGSMAGKSYFLSVAIRQLRRIFTAKLGMNFTDADPAGNFVLAKMIAKLFNPSQNPEDAFLAATQLAGETYSEYQRYGKLVKLPKPFTYNLSSRGKGSTSIVLYDNSGEHFSPGHAEREKSNATEHIAWASGILFLFDPLQHSELLAAIPDDIDPQVGLMKKMGSKMRFDQEVILAEMAVRLNAWRRDSSGQSDNTPLALVVGKHDVIDHLLPREKLTLEVCGDQKLLTSAIDSNSKLTREFLIEYCPDIVGAAEAITDNVKYFPASPFGSPAIQINSGLDSLIGPNRENLKPYLVEAPLLWLLSQAEATLIPT